MLWNDWIIHANEALWNWVDCFLSAMQLADYEQLFRIFNQLKAAWCLVGEGRLVLVCVKCLSWLVFGRCSHLHCLCPWCGEQRHIFTSNSFPAWPTNSVSFGLFDWSLLSVNVRLAELYIYEDSLICAVEITNPRTQQQQFQEECDYKQQILTSWFTRGIHLNCGPLFCKMRI